MSLSVAFKLWDCLLSVIKVDSCINFLDRKFEACSQNQSEIWLIESIRNLFQDDMDSTLHKEFLLYFPVIWFVDPILDLVVSIRAEHIFHLHGILRIFINLSVYSLLGTLALWAPPFLFQDFLPTLHKLRFMRRWKSIIVYFYFPEGLNWAINLALIDIWEKQYFAACCYYLLFFFPHFQCRHIFICVICPAFNSMYQMIQKIISFLLFAEITVQDFYLQQQYFEPVVLFCTKCFWYSLHNNQQQKNLLSNWSAQQTQAPYHAKYLNVPFFSVWNHRSKICKLDCRHPDMHMNLIRCGV